MQIRAGGGYRLYVNDELISDTPPDSSAAPQTHIHEFDDFLLSGTNQIALRVEKSPQSLMGVEAVIFIKNIADWEKRQAEIAAQKKREAENLVFDKARIAK